MKKIGLAFAVIAFLSASALADCSGVDYLDTPPCVPCPFLWSGYWWGTADYQDGSALSSSGDVFTNCDGEHQFQVVSRSYWCPNGPDDEQCIARQHYFNP